MNAKLSKTKRGVLAWGALCALIAGSWCLLEFDFRFAIGMALVKVGLEVDKYLAKDKL